MRVRYLAIIAALAFGVVGAASAMPVVTSGATAPGGNGLELAKWGRPGYHPNDYRRGARWYKGWYRGRHNGRYEDYHQHWR